MFLNVCFLARILDVRGEEDFLRGHLRGAYNVPWAEIASRGFEYLGANVAQFSGRQWSPGSDFTAEVLRLPTRSTPFTVSWQLAERIAL